MGCHSSVRFVWVATFPASFLFTAARREAGALRVQFSEQVLAGPSEHSEKRASEGEPHTQAGGACSFIPDCLGCRGRLRFGESSETPRKLLMGTGLDGERRRYLSPENQKSALGTFTQPHSISPEVGAGLSPPGVRRRQTAGAEQAGRGSGPFSKLGVTSFPPRGAQSGWLSSLLLAGLERSPCPTVCPNSVLLGLPGRKAMCFQREGEQALGFAYCSLSKVAIAVASAHHGGGSLVWDGRGWQGLAGQRGAPSPLTDQPAPLLPVC